MDLPLNNMQVWLAAIMCAFQRFGMYILKRITMETEYLEKHVNYYHPIVVFVLGLLTYKLQRMDFYYKPSYNFILQVSTQESSSYA